MEEANVKEAREGEGFGLFCALFPPCLFYLFLGVLAGTIPKAAHVLIGKPSPPAGEGRVWGLRCVCNAYDSLNFRFGNQSSGRLAAVRTHPYPSREGRGIKNLQCRISFATLCLTPFGFESEGRLFDSVSPFPPNRRPGCAPQCRTLLRDRALRQLATHFCNRHRTAKRRASDWKSASPNKSSSWLRVKQTYASCLSAPTCRPCKAA
jgi:hypothetical protein